MKKITLIAISLIALVFKFVSAQNTEDLFIPSTVQRQLQSDSLNIIRLKNAFDKYRPKYLEQIKDSIKRAMIRDKAIPRLYDDINLDDLDYIIVPYLCISERAKGQNISHGFLEYLDIDTLHFRARAFVFDKGGLFSGPSLIFYCDPMPNFFHLGYIDKEEDFYQGTYQGEPEKMTYYERFLFRAKYKCDFMFSVCGMSADIFTIKNNNVEVFTYNSKMESYDEFVKKETVVMKSWQSTIHKEEGFTEYTDTNYFYNGLIQDKNGDDIMNGFKNFGLESGKIDLDTNNIQKYLHLREPVTATTHIDYCGLIQDNMATIYGWESWVEGYYTIMVANPSPVGIPVVHSMDYFEPHIGYVATPMKK